MASTLFYHTNKSLPRILSPTKATPPPWSNPTNLSIPDVFLFAPEEDNVPPWLLFDAAKDTKRDLSRVPDLEFLDVAMDVLRDADAEDGAPPVHYRGFSSEGMQRQVDTRSRRGTEDGEEVAWPEMPEMPSESEGDSIVVEVVKVRGQHKLDEEARIEKRSLKRSTTLKSVASKAFRSLKKSGKSKKNSAMDIWPSNDDLRSSISSRRSNVDDERPSSEAPRPSTQTVSGQSSLTLNQVFQSPLRQTRSSVDLTEIPMSSDPFSSGRDLQLSLPSYPSSAYCSERDTDSMDEDDRNPHGVQPSVPLSVERPSFRKRISMFELRKVFSSSKSTDSVPSMTRDDGSSSSDPSTSTEASYEPETPDDDEYSSPLSITPQGRKSGPRASQDVRVAEPTNTSFDGEMRLDTLHFESLSLSFDLDAF